MNKSLSRTLARLEAQSFLEETGQVDVPFEDRMLAITKETGELLNMLLHMQNTKNMLEVGMSTGYSTIWCAEAISKQPGQIMTIEKNPDKIKRANANFQEAGVSEWITIREGVALEILTELNSDIGYRDYFDFVLIDADKENTIKYFDLILPMVSVGGLIATDNMLYPKKFRNMMKKFQDHIKANPDLRTMTVPIGNGEELTKKIR